MKYTYQTKNVCPKRITFEIENDLVKNVQFLDGGCPGNLQAVPRLVENMPVQDVIDKLKNIECGLKKTSCADQLATALEEARSKVN